MNAKKFNSACVPEGRHGLGQGWHFLPVQAITPVGLQRLSSEGCILLLFVMWAQQRGFDAVDIYEKANPNEPLLRPDELLIYRQWTEIPQDRQIPTDLLCADLEDINEHRLVEMIQRIERGEVVPEKAYTHWVVTEVGRIAGEARDLDPPPPQGPDEQGQHFCYVRLFAMPEMAEWGYTNAVNLRAKTEFAAGGES